MKNFIPGQPVEANKVLCSNEWPEPPTKIWVPGYTFEGFRGNLVVVKQVKPGLFEGCNFNFNFNYDQDDVREIKASQT